MANSSNSSSDIRKLGRYFLHGLLLGVVVIGASIGALLVGLMTLGSYPPYILLGPSLVAAAFYGMIFALTGGMNQVLASSLWGIDCENNIGTLMRDGFVIFMLFNIVFLPVGLILSVPPWYHWGLSAADAFTILLITMPVYMLLFGVIGAKTAVFLHEDKEPVMPSDFAERTRQCPHCMARYYYGAGAAKEGVVTCQNCGKQFSVNE